MWHGPFVFGLYCIAKGRKSHQIEVFIRTEYKHCDFRWYTALKINNIKTPETPTSPVLTNINSEN